MIFKLTDNLGSFDINDKSDVVTQSAILELLQHLMSEPAFDQLRTKEQLGMLYIRHV